MMRIYLNCPVELVKIEYTRDDRERGRAYITLHNMSAHIAARVCGDVRWTDAQGDAVARHNGVILAQARIDPFASRVFPITAPKGEDLTLDALITHVDYALAIDAWDAAGYQPHIYTEQSELDVKLLNALRRVAGNDAIRLPKDNGDGTWICVCGRLNDDVTLCIRCGRDRVKMMAKYTREGVFDAFDQLEPEVLRTAEYSELRDLPMLETVAEMPRIKRRYVKRALLICARFALLAICAWLLWLALLQIRSRNAIKTPAPTPSVPYNESIIL